MMPFVSVVQQNLFIQPVKIAKSLLDFNMFMTVSVSLKLKIVDCVGFALLISHQFILLHFNDGIIQPVVPHIEHSMDFHLDLTW
jgi:hypothetical protein